MSNEHDQRVLLEKSLDRGKGWISDKMAGKIPPTTRIWREDTQTPFSIHERAGEPRNRKKARGML
jgi:hypothetical protein